MSYHSHFVVISESSNRKTMSSQYSLSHLRVKAWTVSNVKKIFNLNQSSHNHINSITVISQSSQGILKIISK